MIFFFKLRFLDDYPKKKIKHLYLYIIYLYYINLRIFLKCIYESLDTFKIYQNDLIIVPKKNQFNKIVLFP